MAEKKVGYGESYTFKKYPEYEKNILDFIMSSDRIVKDDRFAHVSDDVKRFQTTAVLHRTMMDERVVLCVHRKGMPAAFKVFAARDVKTDRSPKVFIDVTDLVILKDGFYECNKINVLSCYLMAAMMMLVYETNPEKLTTNSTLISTGTSCFVSLFTYILDYLRVNGFAENRIKIGYIAAMYYQCHMLGIDRDRTAMNIAVKASGAATKDINAYEFYYDMDHFQNINTLITFLSDTFKLQGLTTDVFIEKWRWLIGKGTQFGVELYPAFSKVLTDAYGGSYINNHKNIEKCCGRAMVDYTNALLRICSDVLDTGMRYESASERDDIGARRELHPIQEALFTKKEVKEARKELDKALADGNQTAQIAAIKKLVEKLKNESQGEKDKHLRTVWFGIFADSDNYILGSKSGYKPVCTQTAKIIKREISDKLKAIIVESLQKTVNYMPKQLAEKNETFMKHEKESRAILKDAQDALKIME